MYFIINKHLSQQKSQLSCGNRLTLRFSSDIIQLRCEIGGEKVGKKKRKPIDISDIALGFSIFAAVAGVIPAIIKLFS